MTSLFSITPKVSAKRRLVQDSLNCATNNNVSEPELNESSPTNNEPIISVERTFAGLGLCSWILESCKSMGFRRPTPIQSSCIPAILNGRDVMGCAETGSGKTAAFALPILNKLSEDPYGIFALILTPTRELAVQIAEQFNALGAPCCLRTALIIGGENIVTQGSSLARRPHIVIATPGRLRHHLEGPDPPDLSRVKFLVLDEADRLLTAGFESELKIILSCMQQTSRQTLLFSATLNSTLHELEKLTMKDTLKFDLTVEQRIPEQLIQQYLFMPAQVKLCYLVAVLKGLMLLSPEGKRGKQGGRYTNNEDDNEDKEEEDMEQYLTKKKKPQKLKGNISRDRVDDDIPLSSSSSSSVIIFVGTCKRCQETSEVLNQLGIDCVALHSMLTQNRRMAALGKFKSQLTRVLVATDLASRGLDIPQVDLVVNFDLPKIASDYIHRVGRTARAGRVGRSLALVTQYDVELVHSIETVTGTKLSLSSEVNDKDIVDLLNPISKAMRSAQLKLIEIGFDEKIEIFKDRRKKQKSNLLRKQRAKDNNNESSFHNNKNLLLIPSEK